MYIKSGYEFLLNKVNQNPDKYIATEKTCLCLKNLPLDYAEAAQGLMYYHFKLNSKKKNLSDEDYVSRSGKKDNTLSLIYKGKTYSNGKVPQFDLEKLPPILVKIYVAYLECIQV